MSPMIRSLDPQCKFIRALTLEALAPVLSTATIHTVLGEHRVLAPRTRKLTMEAVVWWVIAMHLYPRLSLGGVLAKIAHGLRLLWPDPNDPLPGESALTYRRYQLGARPLVTLFRRVCRPMATPATPGAFLFGLRLMALDGTVEDAPDTPANAAAFGRRQGGRGPSAFPQLQAVYLVECGTHAIVDAGFWPCGVGERKGGFRMLRSVGPGMLVMWDGGFHEYDMVAQARQRGAHVLARLPACVKPEPLRRLPDGSTLARLRPRDKRRRRAGEFLEVRIVRYRVTDAALPGYGKTRALLVTLLDEQQAPALAVAQAYHERWEVEIVIDEIDTHQRLVHRPLRSQKPEGVIQELYGVLLAHYAVRFLMHEAARSAGLDPDRISFVGALRLVTDALWDFQVLAPEQWHRRYERLLCDIARERLPKRRARTSPRVVKRKMSPFALKREQHRRWPQPEQPFHEALDLI
jgi:hypothetical protein